MLINVTVRLIIVLICILLAQQRQQTNYLVAACFLTASAAGRVWLYVSDMPKSHNMNCKT